MYKKKTLFSEHITIPIAKPYSICTGDDIVNVLNLNIVLPLLVGSKVNTDSTRI